MDVIKVADHIIDLGPEGGNGGGIIVCEGTPESVARSKSYTGKFLKAELSWTIQVERGSAGALPPFNQNLEKIINYELFNIIKVINAKMVPKPVPNF